MRKFYSGILTAVLFAASSLSASAQVSAFSFSQSTGTYTEITGGTVLATATGNSGSAGLDDMIYPIANGSFPFTFNFNGTGYTGANVSSNGFITFGATAPGTTTYSPISATTAYAGAISAWGGDLNSFLNIGGQTGEIRWEAVGSSPNREIVIQYKNIRPGFSTSTTNVYGFNFQIRLHENNNISFVYGPGSYLAGSSTISGSRQVGLRGATNADFINRTSTTTWTGTTAGASNSSSVSYSTSTTTPNMPPSGLTFLWTAPQPCVAPSAQPSSLVLTPGAASIGGSFTAASPAAGGYLVVRTATNVAPVPVNGTLYTLGNSAIGYIESVGSSVSFNSVSLTPSTQYYYWVFSYNSPGCTGGPIYNMTSPLTGSATAGICATLSGVKTIPGDYATITAALSALQASGISGPVILELQSGYNSSAETFPIIFSLIPCGSNANSITVRPAAGVTTSISGSVASGALIRILADNVIIDGSNNGTSSRDLSISNTSSTSPSVIHIGSAGTNTRTNVTIKNTIIINGVNTSSAVVISDATLGSAGYFSNIVLENNSIQKAYIGVYSNAVVAPGNGSGVQYLSNDLSSTGADAIRYIGLYAQGIDGLTVRGNTIGNFDGANNEDDKGIWLATGTSNATVEKNRIFNLNYSGTSGYGGHGMYISTGVTNANVTVSNNMIANMSGDGWNYTSVPTDNPIGIVLSGTQTGINVYFNSINLSGNTLNQTNAMSMGIYLANGSIATIKNNIIVNNLGLASTTGYGASGIYAATSNTQLPGINHNNYWVNPTGSGNKYVGQISSTGQGTFAGWQTATSGEAQGYNIQPQFTSATDLHLIHANNATLDGLGTPIAGITSDIDEETRDASTPDMGADEFFACIPPAITTQPTNQTGCTGSDITLSVTATGTAITYQWRKGGLDISGATSDTYTIIAATAGDAGNYDVVITGQCGNITSTAVNVTVDPNTSITAQPVNQTACIGTSATFTVTAVGPDLGYQWRKNSIDIPGAITNVYTIASVTAGDVGNYDVVIAGTCGTATSNAVTLTIGSSLSITTQPANQSACLGGIANFSVTASGGGLTYQWQKDGVDITGATSSTLTINPVVAGSVGSYVVVINSSCGSGLTSNAATLSLAPSTAIISQPQGQNVCANTGASFSVTATGNNLTYQWRKDNNPIPGATGSTYSIASVTVGDVGNYDVVVTGDCGSDTSSVAVLGFTNATAGVWIGSSSSDWNSVSNWCGGVPTTSTDVVISAGAPNMPVISGMANARRIQINTGASVTIDGSGTLNVHGDYVNTGTMTANGTVVFQGGFSQNVQSLTAANITLNTDYGIVLDGNMVVTNTLTLTKGIITTGNYTVTLNNSTSGSLASHIITSQNGVVIMNNVNAGPVIVPVAPDASSYNPVTIANGQGRNYTVKVAAGIQPAIQNPSIAVNRTWGVLASGGALATPVNYTLQYADVNVNANANGAANMEVGLHNGTNWSVISAPAGIAPTGSAGARVINFTTTQSGAFVLSNVGGTTAVPVIDADITSATLMPNVVNGRSVLRVNVRRAMKIDWAVTDMNGRVVLRFVQQLMPGQTDLPLQLANLANGTYQLYGFTNKGKTQLLRFLKL